MLRFGVQAAALCGRPSAARPAAAAIGAAFLKDVRVCPVPYHGGGFAGRECHSIAVPGSIVSDALEGLIPAPQLAALRTVWAACAGVIRTLNRATEIPAEEVADLSSALERFVPDLQVIFSWLSVSSKIHALTHHAPTFLRRFGSLGSYPKQALEAWHACFDRAQAQCTADSFLGSCAQMVQQAALERLPLAERSLSNWKTRKSAAAGTRKAKTPGAGRLRVNKSSHRQTAVGARKEQAEMEAWADGRSTSAITTMNAYKKRIVDAAKRSAALAALLVAETAAHAQVENAAGEAVARTDDAAPAPAVLAEIWNARGGEEKQPPAEDDILEEEGVHPAVALTLR